MSLRAKKFLIIFAGVALLINGAMANPVAYADTSNTTASESNSWSGNATKSSLELIDCGSTWDVLTPSCLVPMVAYYALYIPASGVLYLSGLIFDFMLALSIDKAFIEQDFVETAWGIVRDFSNMVFIFILLYTGIQTMFGLGGGWGKKITTIVILALIINFSMFFCKVIIDAGNTLAVGVYEATGSPKNSSTDNPHPRDGQTVDERNISASLMNAFGPGRFTTLASTSKSSAAMVFLIAAIVSGYAAFIFIKAALMLVGRIIAFWFYIIISPFALISMALPKVNIFNTWLYGLINQAMVAPVFLFLVYLVMYAVNGGKTGTGILSSFTTTTSGTGLWDTIFLSVVVTGMVIYGLQYALKVATRLADDFGKIGAQAATKVLSSFPVGMGANLALGGAAGLLRSTIGQGASKALDSGALRKMSTAGGLTGVFGRGLTRTAERAEKGSFDIRTTGVLQKGAKSLGVDVNFGKVDGKGGWVAEQKTREKEDARRAKRAEVSAQEKAARAAKINPEYVGAKARVEKEYQEERTAVLSYENAKIAASNTDEGKAVKRADAAHLTAKEQRDVAKERLNNSNSRKKVDSAENNVKTMGSTAKMEGDRLAKEIERLKKDQAEAEKNLAFGTSERLKGEITQAEEQAKNAQKLADGAIKNAERELNDAKKELSESAEGKAFTEAEKAVEEARNNLEDAQNTLNATDAGKILEMTKKALENKTAALKVTRKIIKDTEDELKEWENAANERRREAIGRAQTFTRVYLTRADHQEAIKKIRADKSKDDRNREKKKKEVAGIFEEALKQVEKKEEGEKKVDAGGGEKKKE